MQEMTIFESHWLNEFQDEIYITKHETVQPKRACIGFVHGLGEHIGRYKHVFEFFTRHGFSCYGFDSYGHGKSKGKRGHIYSFQQWINEIDMLVNWMRKENTKKPVVLYGHSLGGNKVLNYIVNRHNLPDAAIATSPFIGEGIPSPKLKIVVGRFLSKIVPKLQINNGLVKNALSHDQTINDNYLTDPLVHSKISLNMGAISLDAATRLKSEALSTPIPLLITHGDEDQLTDFETTKEFADLAIGDVQFKDWPGLYHETHNEQNKQEVFDYTLHWLNETLF